MFKALIVIFGLISFVLTGCVKDRPGKLSDSITAEGPLEGGLSAIQPLPGTSESGNLSGINGKAFKLGTESEYTLTTSNVVTKSSLSEAEDRQLGDDIDFKLFDIVNYTTNLDLLGDDLILKAKPNTTYNLRMDLDGNLLKIYRMGTKDTISLDEWITAKNYGGGKYGVPMVGYPVEYLKLQKRRNSDNQETNETVALPVGDATSATHYRIKKLSKKLFDQEEKIDVYPKELFDGEWYYSESIIATPVETDQYVGSLGAFDENFESSTRIRFHRTKDFIFGLNVNVDEEIINSSTNLDFNSVFKVPVTWVDYRVKENGLFETMEEEVVSEVDWTRNRYVSFKVSEIQTASTIEDSIFAQVSALNDVAVKQIKLNKDYMSFTISHGSSNKWVKYAFKRVDTNNQYRPRNHFNADHNKFGYFTAVLKQINDHRQNDTDDYEKLVLQTRHNPDKDIVYRFSSNTPKDKWVRDIGREAMNLWDQAAKKAGLSIRFVLDESYDCDLGDIRCNLINLPSESVSGLLGFGPSLSDSTTGEIIAATANVYLRNEQEGLIRRLRAFSRDYLGLSQDPRNRGQVVDARLAATSGNAESRLLYALSNGLFETVTDKDGHKIDRFMHVYMPRDQHSPNDIIYRPIYDVELDGTNFSLPMMKLLLRASSSERIGQQYMKKELIGLNIQNLLSNISNHNLIQLFKSGQIANELARNHYDLNMQKLTASGKNEAFFKIVQENCSGYVGYLKGVKAANALTKTADELEHLYSCSRLLLPLQTLGTLVHEIGHTIGLRHNFQGSADPDNFVSKSDYTLKYVKEIPGYIKPKSSSIMEYTDETSGVNIYPGKYDIAALRFGYGEQVEVKHGDGVKVVDLLSDKPISDVLEPGQELVGYKFCTDGHVSNSSYYNCNRFDEGATPSEMVKSISDNIFERLKRIYRYESIYFNNDVLGQLVLFRKIYEEWRNKLQQNLGTNIYLEDIETEEFQKIVDELIKDDPHMKDLYEARNRMVQVMLKLASIPNRYCVLENENGVESLFEFSKLQDAMRRRGFVGSLFTCQDEVAKEFFAESDQTVTDEYGFPLRSGSFQIGNLDIGGSARLGRINLDYIGTYETRQNAFLLLAVRNARVLEETNFLPSMLDEPDIRRLVNTFLVDRISEGVKINNAEFDERAEELNGFDVDKIMGNVLNGTGYSNYITESGLVSEMFELFLSNVTEGDISFDTSDRLAPMRTIVTSRPSEVSGAVGEPIRSSTPGLFYTFQAGQGDLARKLLEKSAKEKRLVSFGKLSQEDINDIIRRYTKVYEDIFSEIPEDSMTVENVVSVLEGHFQASAEISKDYPSVPADFMNEMFESEFVSLLPLYRESGDLAGLQANLDGINGMLESVIGVLIAREVDVEALASQTDLSPADRLEFKLDTILSTGETDLPLVFMSDFTLFNMFQGLLGEAANIRNAIALSDVPPGENILPVMEERKMKIPSLDVISEKFETFTNEQHTNALRFGGTEREIERRDQLLRSIIDATAIRL